MKSSTAKRDDQFFMWHAFLQARKAFKEQEVPIGAVIVCDDEIIGKGFNRVISACDPSAHAEVVAMRDAAKTQRNYRLANTTLYVTVEPCTMCLGTLMHARIKRVVFGAKEPKAGVLESHAIWQQHAMFNHSIDVCGGVLEQECSELIKAFFAARREKKRALKRAR